MYASSVKFHLFKLFCHWNLHAWQNLTSHANLAYSWGKAEPASFGNCFIVPQWLLNVGKEQEQLQCGERKRWDSLVGIWFMRRWLCGTLSKPWGLAEVRSEEQAEGGRIYKDMLFAIKSCTLASWWWSCCSLLTRKSISASVSGNRLVAVLDGTPPGSSGFLVPL